jgi:hypothetical protein
MATAESSSHHVYVSPDVVVKIIDAGRHSRLDREIALAPQLPAGLTAPLPGSGLCRLGTRDGSADCTAGYPPATPDRRWENLLTTAGSSARLRSWPRLRTSRPWTGTESWPALCSTA